MHEFALYGLVPGNEKERMLQQLAGVTRMQPIPVQEIHLVFKAQTPLGLAKIPSAGGSQGVMQQEIQRLKAMLSGSLYYVQVVGDIQGTTQPDDKDVEMVNGEHKPLGQLNPVRWRLEFRDTPDPGKQVVSTRLCANIPIEDGNMIEFMKCFGYDFTSRYLVIGSKFYDQDIALFLHQVMQVSQPDQTSDALYLNFMETLNEMKPLDGSGGQLLQTSIDVVDGNNPDLKDRAIKQLLAMKETLKQAVVLSQGDRLALDTRLSAATQRA